MALRGLGVPTREFRVDDYGAPRYPELILATSAETLRDDPDLVATWSTRPRPATTTSTPTPRSASTPCSTPFPTSTRPTRARQLAALTDADAFRLAGRLDRATARRAGNAGTASTGSSRSRSTSTDAFPRSDRRLSRHRDAQARRGRAPMGCQGCWPRAHGRYDERSNAERRSRSVRGRSIPAAAACGLLWVGAVVVAGLQLGQHRRCSSLLGAAGVLATAVAAAVDPAPALAACATSPAPTRSPGSPTTAASTRRSPRSSTARAQRSDPLGPRDARPRQLQAGQRRPRPPLRRRGPARGRRRAARRGPRRRTSRRGSAARSSR